MAESSNKKSYEKPKLEQLGTIGALTAGGSGSSDENGNGNGGNPNRRT